MAHVLYSTENPTPIICKRPNWKKCPDHKNLTTKRPQSAKLSSDSKLAIAADAGIASALTIATAGNAVFMAQIFTAPVWGALQAGAFATSLAAFVIVGFLAKKLYDNSETRQLKKEALLEAEKFDSKPSTNDAMQFQHYKEIASSDNK